MAKRVWVEVMADSLILLQKSISVLTAAAKY